MLRSGMEIGGCMIERMCGRGIPKGEVCLEKRVDRRLSGFVDEMTVRCWKGSLVS